MNFPKNFSFDFADKQRIFLKILEKSLQCIQNLECLDKRTGFSENIEGMISTAPAVRSEVC